MVIFKEKARIISEKPIWVCFHGPYMYTGDTLIELFVYMFKNWDEDSELVG